MNTISSGMLDRADFLMRQREILEQVFDDGWFLQANKKDKQHPAYARWQLCQTLIDQGGTIRGDQLRDVGEIALDTYYFVQLTEGNREQLKLGLFALVGDENVRAYIRSRIDNPDFYEDIMVQLYVASWYKANHQAVSLVEKDGWPDVRVNLSVPNIPMLVECKRLRSTGETSPEILERKIRRVTYKADTQIKHAVSDLGHGHCYGVLVLDVSSIVPKTWTELGNIPQEALQAANFAQRALSGNKNTSVHVAIVVWDTHKLEVDPSPSFRYICARRCLRVKHLLPRPIFPENTPPALIHIFQNLIDGYLLADYEFQLVAARDT